MRGAGLALLASCLVVAASAQTLSPEAEAWLGGKKLTVKVYTKVPQ